MLLFVSTQMMEAKDKVAMSERMAELQLRLV
jgi:hypothetical protein